MYDTYMDVIPRYYSLQAMDNVRRGNYNARERRQGNNSGHLQRTKTKEEINHAQRTLLLRQDA